MERSDARSMNVPRALPLCNVCSAYDYTTLETLRGYPRNRSPIDLGLVRDIIRREACPLCKLALVVITSWVPFKSYEANATYLNIPCTLQPLWEAPAFAVKTGDTERGKIRVWSESDFKSCDPSNWSIDDAGYYAFAQLDMKTIAHWLKTDWWDGKWIETAKIDTERSIMLIDVVQYCLVPNAHFEFKYAALSYVRGGVPVFETSQSNIDELCQSGSLRSFWPDLPKAVQDGIDFVMELGVRYLWVDSLCIVQDDDAKKHTEISRMHEIYQHASFTIAVLSSPHADCNLPGVKPGTRSPLRRLELVSKDEFVDYTASTSGRPDSNRSDSNNRLPFALSTEPASLEALVEYMPYYGRGWTFQEHLLSRRCLLLTSQQAYFWAGTAALCTSEARDSILFRDDVELSSHLMNTRLYHKDNTPDSVHLHIDSIPKFGTLGYDEKSVEVYEKLYYPLVQAYTRRQLTFDLDILNAFAGVSARLQEAYGTPMICGVPRNAIPHALMWIPATRQLCRRAGPSSHGLQVSFPSWSWAGWVGPVLYMHRTSMLLQTACSVVSVGHMCKLDATERATIVLQADIRDTIGLYSMQDKWSSTTGSWSSDVPHYPYSWLRSRHGSQRKHDGTIGALLDYGSTPQHCFTDGRHYLILLSRLHQGPQLWTNYVLYMHKFIGFSKIGYILNVMLVRRLGDDDLYERVAIGQLHPEDWPEAGPCSRKRIRLV